jgi:hypothetical protein
MRRRAANRSQKSAELMSRTTQEHFRWLVGALVPKLGKLYDELAAVGIVPAASNRGRPMRRSAITMWAATQHRKRPLIEIGAAIEARNTGRDPRLIVDAAQHLPSERERLRKLARRYVKHGQAANKTPELEDWPPPLASRQPLPPGILRKHLQDALFLTMANWVAKDAAMQCDRGNGYHQILSEVANQTSIVSGVVWLFEDPRDVRRPRPGGAG